MTMTLAEFIATGRDVADLAAEGIDDNGGPGRVYADGFYINALPNGCEKDAGARWYLVLERDDWLSVEIGPLESRLYKFAISYGGLGGEVQS